MALADKLSQMTEQLQEQKSQEAILAQQQELAPIRAKIKELEVRKNQLDLIKGSLEVQPVRIRDYAADENDVVVPGTRQYDTITKNESEKTTKTLDDLIKANAEALKTKNIENIHDLIGDEDFAQEEEVVSYKQAAKSSEDLKARNALLHRRLDVLGIHIPIEDFSYDVAETAIAEKMKSIDDELVQEKIKTPEGRKAAVETLAKDLENVIPNLLVGKDENSNAHTLAFGYSDSKVVVFGENNKNVKFEGWSRASLVSEDFANFEKKYNPEILQEALNTAYKNKIEKSFKDFEKNKNDIDSDLLADLERSSPEKRVEALGVVREFRDLAVTLKNTLNQKSEELKLKGIDFDPNYVQNYGGQYKEYCELTMSDQANQIIKETLQNPDVYPPRVNFDSLKELTEKRIEHINELIADIKKIDNQADIQRFTGTTGVGIYLARKNMSDTKNYDIIRQVYSPGTGSWEQTKVKGLMKFNSYAEAKNYFEQKATGKENIKQKFLYSIETAFVCKQKMTELQNEAAMQNLRQDPNPSNYSISNIESEFESIQRNKKAALELMSQITSLESSLPQEELILSNGKIEVLSVSQKMEKLKIDTQTQKQNLIEVKQRLEKNYPNKTGQLLEDRIKNYPKKPALFGKDTWQNNLDDLNLQKELEQKISKMEREDYNELYNKRFIYIRTDEYSPMRKIIEEQNAKGLPGQILEGLKVGLKALAEREAPATVVKLLAEYKALQSQLQA